MDTTPRPEKPARRRAGARRSVDAPDAPGDAFRGLIDGAVHGIVVHRNFKPLYANAAFARLFGYKDARDILALPLLRRLVPDDIWPRLESDHAELLRGTKPFLKGRSRGIRRDGSEFWIAVTMRIVDWADGAGGHAPALAMMVGDISAEVEIEHGLQKTEQRMRAVLEILPYPIYIARRSDGQILFVNRKSCLLFQRSTAQFLKLSSHALYVDPRDRDTMAALIDKVSDVRDIEMQMKTAQDRVFTAELAMIALDYGHEKAILVAINDISQRKEMEAELFRQASTDVLTGISNRRHFEHQAEQEVRRARRFARDLTVMMIDIDHFKPINDTYGHAVGDAVLQGVVRRALESLRGSDQIGRIGGEEFAVLLPETPLDAAIEVAERLRAHVAARPIVAEKTAIPCTVSIGVAQLSGSDGRFEDALARADAALYRAKKAGRDRVERA